MVPSPAASTTTSPQLDAALAYQPGVCNIGPAEISRRRRAGHAGLVVSAGLFASLVVVKAPRAFRLIVALPAAASASGYLQARFRFCAGFGARGVYNFGDVGPTFEVADPEALARDRTRARQIGMASAAIGGVVGLLAAIAPP